MFIILFSFFFISAYAGGSHRIESTTSDIDSIQIPNRNFIKGDIVFVGDGSWYLKLPYEIPWDNVTPSIPQNTTDYIINWSEPMRLTYFEGDDWRPKAVVEDSVIHLIWNHRGWGISDIYYMRSTDWGETWSDTFNLSFRGWCMSSCTNKPIY